MNVNPITLEVVRNALVAYAEEMANSLCKSAYNMMIYEVRDFCCGLVDVDGQLICQNSGGLPIFLADHVALVGYQEFLRDLAVELRRRDAETGFRGADEDHVDMARLGQPDHLTHSDVIGMGGVLGDEADVAGNARHAESGGEVADFVSARLPFLARGRRDEPHRALDSGNVGVVLAFVGGEDRDQRELLRVERGFPRRRGSS